MRTTQRVASSRRIPVRLVLGVCTALGPLVAGGGAARGQSAPGGPPVAPVAPVVDMLTACP